jgi:hypothetical protein
MDKISRNILRYSDNIPLSAFNEPQDIPSQEAALEYVRANLTPTTLSYSYLIWGERNGTIGSGTGFAFGNGASADNALIMPHNARLTRLGLASDGTVSGFVLAFQINGADVASHTFNANGLSSELDIAINAGDVVSFVGRGGSATSDNRVFAEITVDQSIEALMGPKGEKGDDGVTYNEMRFGDGVPPTALGNDGDIYTDRSNGDQYKKISGTWQLQLNILVDTGTVTGRTTFVIYAEQNDLLGLNSGEEWAFGNGAEVTGNGLVIGQNCQLVKIGFATTDDGTGAEVEVLKNGVSTGASVLYTGGGRTLSTLSTPVDFQEGDLLTFRTVTPGSINAASSTVAAYFESEIIGLKGDKGDKGDRGADGDLSWRSIWDAGTVYDINEAVSYNGSSYICTALTVAGEDPVSTPAKWDVLAQAPAGLSIPVAQKIDSAGGANVNQLTPTVFSFNTEEITTAGVFQSTPNGIQVLQAGVYECYFSIGVSSTIARPNLYARFRINGVGDSVPAKSFYIRAASNHNESSSSLQRIFTLSAGDIIEVETQQEGEAGAVTALINQSTLSLKKLQ